jgi:hypothetical protein
MRVFTLILLAGVILSLAEAGKKGKGKKGKKGKKPSKKPSIFDKYTVDGEKGQCWWDLTKNNCGVCKNGGVQCGYPLHKYCYKDTGKGCPGIPTNIFTLSTIGHPCYWDHSDTSCAWCVRGAAQCGPNGSKVSRKVNHCAMPKNSKFCDMIKQSCKYMGKDICDSMAECNDMGKCECKAGWTGNGVQCVDENGNFAPENNVEVSMTVTNEFFVYPDGSDEYPMGPSTDNLFSEMEGLVNGGSTCSMTGCSFNKTTTP